MICSHCNGTGDTGSGYLDCVHCESAMVIAAHEARKSAALAASPAPQPRSSSLDNGLSSKGMLDKEAAQVAPTEFKDAERLEWIVAAGWEGLRQAWERHSHEDYETAIEEIRDVIDRAIASAHKENSQ